MKPQGNITITHNIYCAAHQIKILTLRSYFPHFVLPDATCLASSKKLQGRPKVKHTHDTTDKHAYSHTNTLKTPGYHQNETQTQMLQVDKMHQKWVV